MRYELPPEFQWDSTDQWGRDWLRCGRKIVASVSQTVFEDARWIATVNRHDEAAAVSPHAYFRTRQAAMRSVERWACAHALRLRQELPAGSRPAAAVIQPTREEKRLERAMRS